MYTVCECALYVICYVTCGNAILVTEYIYLTWIDVVLISFLVTIVLLALMARAKQNWKICFFWIAIMQGSGYLEWGQTKIAKPVDCIKLDNPFAGQYLFKPSYASERRPKMGYLMSWEYGRMWKREHRKYLLKRLNRSRPKTFKPDIYYTRRRLMKSSNRNETKLTVRTKKYEKTRYRIDNGK